MDNAEENNIQSLENKQENNIQKPEHEIIANRIEALGDEERAAFCLQRNILVQHQELAALRNEGKININDFKKLFSPMVDIDRAILGPLRRKMDQERLREMDSLIAEYSRSKSSYEIKSVDGFEGLFDCLNKYNLIRGSKDDYTIDRLKTIIEKVRNGELGVSFVTNTYGLRDKVRELLDTEARKKEGQQKELEQIKKDESEMGRVRNVITGENSSEDMMASGIKKSQNFAELFTFLGKHEGIQGSREYFSTKKLIEAIDFARVNPLFVNGVTREHGLRDKVEELLKKGMQ